MRLVIKERKKEKRKKDKWSKEVNCEERNK